MATMPDIKIQLDEEALKEQMRTALREVFDEFSIKLRMAADELNPGFIEQHERWQMDEVKAAYNRGVKAGKQEAGF